MKSRAVKLALAALFGLSTLFGQTAPASAEPPKKTRPVEPSPAPAVEQGENTRHERAKELYEQAAAAYSARRHFEAIELFRQSAAIEPSPLLSYNMALAYEEAGDLRNALKYFREYASTSDASDQEVKARITRLESKLGRLGIQQLTVKSNPAGATLAVDGTPVGVTPYTAEFTPGAHTLSVSKPGYVAAEASVELSTDRAANVTLTLSEAPPPTKPAPAQAPAPPPTPKDERSTLARIEPLSWSLLGVGVGALTAGVVFELSRAGSEDEARKADDPVDAAEAQGAADSKQLTSILLLGAGGAFSITGAILAVLDVSRGTPYEGAARQPATPRAASASLNLTHEYQGLQVRGSF